MIPFEQALRIVLDAARPMDTEEVALEDAVGRILAEDVRSDRDMPPFNKSAMDGYACRRADLGGELRVIETIPAGVLPQKAIGENQCAKIMTGSMVPEGADCVIMVEYVEELAGGKVRFVGHKTADNICAQGEDGRAGEILLRRGERIQPQHAAILATVGCVRPRVARRPRVGVIATGDELVEPGERPTGPQIRNSNSSQLCAQIRAMGAEARYFGIARDSEQSTDRLLKEALAASDVVLLSGGVSAGDFDFVPGVMRRNKIEILFEQIAIKPGKPTVFGHTERTAVFGLPGNPVSTFTLFEILVKPFLFKRMGHDERAAHIVMPLEKAVTLKATDRQTWIPVVLSETGGVVPVDFHGSAHSLALCRADGLMVIPLGVACLPAGTLVRVRRI